MARHRFCCCSFFFFQAEDGIRDIGVTGVQTCALPISSRPGGEAMMRRCLMALLLLLGGCAAPLAVDRLDQQAAYRRLNRSALAEDRLSETDRKRVGAGKSVDLGGRRII